MKIVIRDNKVVNNNKVYVYLAGQSSELFSGFYIDKSFSLNFGHSYKTYFDYMGGQMYEQLASALAIGLGGNLSIVTSTMYTNLYIKTDVISFDVNILINEYITNGGNVLNYLYNNVFKNILPASSGRPLSFISSIRKFFDKQIEEGKENFGPDNIIVMLASGTRQALEITEKGSILSSPSLGGAKGNVKVNICNLLIFNNVVLEKASIKFPMWFRTVNDINSVELSLSFKSNEIMYVSGEKSTGNVEYDSGKLIFG